MKKALLLLLVLAVALSLSACGCKHENTEVQGAVEAIRYYGGEPAGVTAIFATVDECAGYPVASIFDPHDLPDYQSYDAHSCPWCKEGKKIDALVNSFGYSSL